MRPRDERGFATAQAVVLLALSFTFLAWFANVLLIQYQEATARAALSDAARQAARVNGTQAECETKILAVLDDVVPGAMRRNPPAFSEPSCSVTRTAVTAAVSYNFSSWFPGLNPRGTMTVTVQKRQDPTATVPG